MNYTMAAVATSIAGLLLGLGWLFAGSLVLKRWGLEATTQGLLVGRRLGVAYLGIAVLLFFGRTAPPSELRSVICVAMMLALMFLAILGLLEFRAKRVGKGILVSVALEAILSIGFALVLLT